METAAMTASFLQEVLPDVTARLEHAVRAQRLPGLAVGIVQDQELAWFGGFGYSDLASSKRPTEHTLFRVASITKTLTTAAILQLRDAGRLGLDDPLAQHLPEFAAARARAGTVDGVTLRRMLAHRAGLTTEAPLPSWNAPSFPTREELVAALPRLEVVIPQDSAFKYSNLAFGLLGEVIARVSGRLYADYMQAEVLGPLRMVSSVFELTDASRPWLATGYLPGLFDDEPRRAPYASLDGVAACGQLHSSVHDLSRWIALQFRTEAAERNGSQILSGPTLEESHRPQYLEPDWSTGYCLGWRATRTGDRVYHGHGGGIHGFASQILFSKPHKLGVICLANLWPHPGLLATATEILEILVPARINSTPPADEPRFEKTPPEWSPLLGLYIAAPGVPLHVAYRGGALRLDKSPLSDYLLHVPATLEPTETADTFLVRGGRGAGERITFERSAAGQVEQFELGGFVYKKQTEAS
jgi:CubicO group peptidase (beta-lactamase class C family)